MIMFFVRSANQVVTIASAVITCFDQIESVWNLLFNMRFFYFVVLYLSAHLCIFCFVVVVLSMYSLLVRCILCFVYSPKNGGGGGDP